MATQKQISSAIYVGRTRETQKALQDGFKRARLECELLIEAVHKAAISLAVAKKPEIVFLDWLDLSMQEGTKFVQKTRGIRSLSETYIVFIAPHVTPSLLSIASEYECRSILLSGKVSEKLPSVLESLQTELSVPSGFRLKMQAYKEALVAGQDLAVQTHLKALVRSFPDSAAVKLEQANHFIRENQWEKANSLAENLWKNFPQDLRIANLMARVCLNKGDTALAMRILQDAEVVSPDNVDRLVMIGEVFKRQSQTEDAEKSFHKALAILPDHPAAQLGLATVHMPTELVTSALKALRSANTEDEVGALFNNTAVGAARTGQLQAALQLYDVALNVVNSRTNQAKVFFNKGLCLHKSRRSAEAGPLIQRAIDLEPQIFSGKKISQVYGNGYGSESTLGDDGLPQIESLEDENTPSPNSPGEDKDASASPSTGTWTEKDDQEFTFGAFAVTILKKGK